MKIAGEPLAARRLRNTGLGECSSTFLCVRTKVDISQHMFFSYCIITAKYN
jgi:hypothetical protein